MRTSGGKLLGRFPCTLTGLHGERMEASLQDGKMVFVTEAAIDGDLLLFLSALVPAALKDSPEVARFFGSLRLLPQK